MKEPAEYPKMHREFEYYFWTAAQKARLEMSFTQLSFILPVNALRVLLMEHEYKFFVFNVDKVRARPEMEIDTLKENIAHAVTITEEVLSWLQDFQMLNLRCLHRTVLMKLLNQLYTLLLIIIFWKAGMMRNQE